MPWDGLKVESIGDPRWQVALSLIESGEGSVHLGSVTLSHDIAGPASTGLVRIELEVSEGTPGPVAAGLLDDLRRHVDELMVDDVRLGVLLRRYGFSCEVITDYGKGTSRLAGPWIQPALG